MTCDKFIVVESYRVEALEAPEQMALRIRRDGRILCAAMHQPEPGDTYLDDDAHYHLSVVKGALVTEPIEGHVKHGQWWWAGNVPEGVVIEPRPPHEPESKPRRKP